MNDDKLSPFSGTLSIISRTPETNPRGSIELPVNQVSVAVASESKTFRKWIPDLPWILQSTTSVSLAQWTELTVTVLRATDPPTGGYVVQGTLAFRQTSSGWRVPFNPSVPQEHGLTVRVSFLDSRDGVLETWSVTNNQVVACGDAGLFVSFKQTLRPDWYDILAAAVIVIDPATWNKC
jgi:hypothetical protein